MRIPALTAVALAALPAQVAAQEGADLVNVDLGLLVLTIVVFLLVLVVLGKFAWGPMLGALEAREDGIRSSIDEAKAMRAEAEELREEHRKELADARRQSQEILAEGRAAAERIRGEMEEKARHEADRILERARIEIGRERDAALEEIRRESVELALAAASRLLDERLTADRDRQLVEGYLKDIRAEQVEA
ncbi:MAG: ATP synthase F0 subunit B [Gemmatimonadales bacterium]|nr:MAG: ATP synthase F0 subunit B [Gemmatimonadales bacterium]